MFLSVGLCVLVFVASTALPKTGANDSGNDKEYMSRNLVKRSLSLVIGAILKKATLVYSSKNFQWFFKSGGFKQAEKDIKSLRLKDVKGYGNTRWAHVGDQTVFIQRLEEGTSLSFLQGKPFPMSDDIWQRATRITYRE